MRTSEVYGSAYAWAGEAVRGWHRAQAFGPALALFVFAAAVLSAQSQDLIEKSERGKSLMAAGKFEEAIPVYRQLSRAVPDNPGLLLNLGMALQMSGHSRDAIRPLENALKLDSGILPARLFLGAAWLGAGDPARAVAPLKKYVELQDGDPSGHQLLADAFLATNEFRDAAAEYRKLSEMDPANPRAWYGLNRSQTALAQSAFDAVAKAAPESAWWLALVADERVTHRQFKSAFFFYRKAQALQPDLPGLHAAIANVYRETGHPDWAEAESRKEPQPSPRDCNFASEHYRAAEPSRTPEADYWRSRTFACLAREAAARLERLPEGPEIHELRAEALRARRQHLEAIKEWRLALKYSPKDVHLKEGLLSSLYQVRDYRAALPLVDELLREDPASAELNFTKGDILLSSQQSDKAIPYLNAALKRDPELAAAHHALGRAYMQVGQPAAAIPHLKAALPLDEDGSLRYQLAKAYQSTGQPELAKTTLAEYQAWQKRDREEKTRLERELEITPP